MLLFVRFHPYKRLKSALGSHEEEQLHALNKMLQLIPNISFGRSLPFVKGIETATKSIRDLYFELKSEGQPYLQTYLLNQARKSFDKGIIVKPESKALTQMQLQGDVF